MILGPRQKIIGELILRQRGFFYVDQVVKDTGYSRTAVRYILADFIKEGFIREISRWPRSQYKEGRPPMVIRYCIINKKALILKIVGQLCEGSHLGRNRIWDLIRWRRVFTMKDLVLLAGVKRENARTFIKQVRRGGFIMASKPTGRGTYWTLVKDPGPRRVYTPSALSALKQSKAGGNPLLNKL